MNDQNKEAGEIRAAFEKWKLTLPGDHNARTGYEFGDMYSREGFDAGYRAALAATRATTSGMSAQIHGDLRLAWSLLESAGHESAAERVFEFLSAATPTPAVEPNSGIAT